MAEQGPYPSFEGMCAACDATAENWVCAASADLQTIADMLLSATALLSRHLKKMHKDSQKEFVAAVLYKPLQAVWNGMPIHEALRAIREGTR